MDKVELRAYAKNALPEADRRRDMVVLPMAALQEVEKAKEIALQKTEEAKKANDAAEEARLQLEATQLQIAEDAAQLSKEGKIEFAREKLTKLVTLDFGQCPRNRIAGIWQPDEGCMAGVWETEPGRDVYLSTRRHRISGWHLPALAWSAKGPFPNGQSQV